MTLALFDFDGTISDRDSMRLFLRYYAGSGRYALGCLMLSPIILAYYLKLIDPKRSKEIMLNWFLGGAPTDEVQEIADRFGKEILPSTIRTGAQQELDRFKSNGIRIIVVSASCELWLKQWCTDQGIELLATRMEEKEGRCTGKIAGGNCRDEEKVNRIKAHLDIKQFDNIVAFGDTSGDKAMLEMADQAHFKPFRS